MQGALRVYSSLQCMFSKGALQGALRQHSAVRKGLPLAIAIAKGSPHVCNRRCAIGQNRIPAKPLQLFRTMGRSAYMIIEGPLLNHAEEAAGIIARAEHL